MAELVTLLETVRVRGGTAPLWPLHLERLQQSAAALGLPVPPQLAAPDGGDDRVVRIAVSADGVQVTTRALGPTTPMQLLTSVVTHPGYPHKTTQRGAFVAAHDEAVRRGADDALLLDGDGHVAEGTIWALGWWEHDAVVFPPIELGVLPSVGRRRIEQFATCRTARAALASLRGRACLLVNAARGVVPVAALDGVALPADARTLVLQQQFWP